ncbi:hypothetical protein KAR91_83715 [Candidatus Pacearchaeota archaeon]|nr:hypothetical protein [Candidatus Pacearchaeota archaeon]
MKRTFKQAHSDAVAKAKAQIIKDHGKCITKMTFKDLAKITLNNLTGKNGAYKFFVELGGWGVAIGFFSFLGWLIASWPFHFGFLICAGLLFRMTR